MSGENGGGGGGGVRDWTEGEEKETWGGCSRGRRW